MTKSEYRAYIQSEDWQQRRKVFLQTEGYGCRFCSVPRWLAQLVYDQDLHVHHRNYQRVGCETYADLMALCRRCHEIETFGRSSLREIPRHECDCCGSVMFDMYAETCESCSVEAATAQFIYSRQKAVGA